MLRHTHRPTIRRDPADWEFHVRLDDGTWLGRPEPLPDAPPSNAETWTRRIPDSWPFDGESEARRAAIAHGASPDGFRVIPAPRRGGEWLKGEGAYGSQSRD